MKWLKKVSWIFLITSINLLYAGNVNALAIDLNAPVNDLTGTVDLSHAPGAYAGDAVGTDGVGVWDAWSALVSTNCGDKDGCYQTGTAKNKGWLNTYSLASQELVDVSASGRSASNTSGTSIALIILGIVIIGFSHSKRA